MKQIELLKKPESDSNYYFIDQKSIEFLFSNLTAYVTEVFKSYLKLS